MTPPRPRLTIPGRRVRSSATGASHVDVDHAHEILHGREGKLADRGMRRVVDDQTEVQSGAFGLQAPQKLECREIAVQAADLDAAGAAKTLGQLIQKGFPSRHQDQVHAASRKRMSPGSSEAFGGSGYQRPGAVALRVALARASST